MYIIKNHDDDLIYLSSKNKWFAHKLARAIPESENKSTVVENVK